LHNSRFSPSTYLDTYPATRPPGGSIVVTAFPELRNAVRRLAGTFRRAAGRSDESCVCHCLPGKASSAPEPRLKRSRDGNRKDLAEKAELSKIKRASVRLPQSSLTNRLAQFQHDLTRRNWEGRSTKASPRAVPKGQLEIAPRFIAGETRLPSRFVPRGRLNGEAPVQASLRDARGAVPSSGPRDESRGYFPVSLRDKGSWWRQHRVPPAGKNSEGRKAQGRRKGAARRTKDGTTLSPSGFGLWEFLRALAFDFLAASRPA
jgi:hypothetical protein